jgi:hypothetical protein
MAANIALRVNTIMAKNGAARFIGATHCDMAYCDALCEFGSEVDELRSPPCSGVGIGEEKA